jgi:hypothetical protein
LDEINFAGGIENDGTVDNDTSNYHGVIGYLPHKPVTELIKTTLNPKNKITNLN